MTATKKTVGPPIDLRGQNAWRERREAATKEVEKLAPEAEPGSDEPPEASPVRESRKPLVQRKMAIPVSYLCPDTGNVLRGDLISEVPGEEGLKQIAMNTRRRLNFAPPNTWPEWEVLRAEHLSTIEVQITDAPDWFAERIGEDNGFMIEVRGRLAEHSSAYFRGDDSPREGVPAKPRLELGALTPLANS